MARLDAFSSSFHIIRYAQYKLANLLRSKGLLLRESFIEHSPILIKNFVSRIKREIKKRQA